MIGKKAFQLIISSIPIDQQPHDRYPDISRWSLKKRRSGPGKALMRSCSLALRREYTSAEEIAMISQPRHNTVMMEDLDTLRTQEQLLSQTHVLHTFLCVPLPFRSPNSVPMKRVTGTAKNVLSNRVFYARSGEETSARMRTSEMTSPSFSTSSLKKRVLHFSVDIGNDAWKSWRQAQSSLGAGEIREATYLSLR
jgi:hypothetical protein